MLTLPSIYLYSWSEWHLLQQKDVKSVLIKDQREVVLCEQMSPVHDWSMMKMCPNIVALCGEMMGLRAKQVALELL